MAKADLKIIKGAGPTVSFPVDDRTTSSQTTNLLPGEPIKQGTNFVIALATGDPEVGTDEMVGIVRKTSTETSTVDGAVEAYTLIPGITTVRGKATTAANVDTQAKINALTGNWVALDLTGTGTNGATAVFTIDEDEGDDPNVHGFKILRGNPVRGTLDCLVHVNATQSGSTR